MEKQRILLVDDNEINRVLIFSMLVDKYEIVEATNGKEALAQIQSYHGDIDLMLLDLVMPEMGGLEVLQEMNDNGWIDDVPVIVISSEDSISTTRKAYELGAEDYIRRPFDPETVARRIQKAILLHSEKKNLIDALTEEFANRERHNDMLINILSHIVEQRNGESGLHVLHISAITALLLESLIKKTDKYDIKQEDISLICNGSSFHDIGKMGIPDEILNKPGRLTKEEFEVIKTHSMIGYEMMAKVIEYENEPLLRIGKNICRHHHERWDGRGYPDQLKGDEIPIEAQVVSLADVYDALTSDRCYKKAYSHDVAYEMILNGECGEFNPLLIECFKEIKESLKTISSQEKETLTAPTKEFITMGAINKINATKNTDVSRNIRLLRQEERRHEAFKVITDEAWFEYYTNPSLIKLNPIAGDLFNLPLQIINPFENEEFNKVFGEAFKENFYKYIDKIGKHFEEELFFNKNIVISNGKKYALKGKLFFTKSVKNGFEDYISGAIGKITCIEE